MVCEGGDVFVCVEGREKDEEVAWGFAPKEKIAYRMMKIASITIDTTFILNHTPHHYHVSLGVCMLFVDELCMLF